MILNLPNRINVEDFVIENNILKGTNQELTKTHKFGEVLFDTLSSHPDHVGQIEAETNRQTTFGEMKEQSVRCALWMNKQGIGAGDIVTFCTNNNMDMYIPILATFYSGAIYNAWFHEVTLKSAQHLMKLFQPKVIFSCESAANVLAEAAKLENVSPTIIIFGNHPNFQSLNDILQFHSDEELLTYRPQEIKNPQQIALIALSSGSSGFPKGVVFPYQYIVNNIICLAPYLIKGRVLWYSTCYWISGFASMLHCILLYSTRIIHARFDPEKTCRVIEKFKVDITFITPAAITYLCKFNVLKKFDLTSLKYIYTAGTKINLKVLEELKKYVPNAVVMQVYAMTESGCFIAGQTENSKSLNSVGFVAPHFQVKIVDTETGKTLGPNEPGELCLKNPTMMIGYYKNPQMTKETIDEDGWLRSGDKAYFNENGEIFIVDRLKDVMKYQGHHVSPTEIEEVLLSHPGVFEVAVVPIPHEIDGDRAMAFVKKAPGANVTEQELVKLSLILGEIKKLHGGVKFLEELPKTATGKIHKKVLMEMA